MLLLSSNAIAEKNKIASTGSWLVLLDLYIPSSSITIRLVDNNEDVEWPTGSGTLYQAFPFEIGGIVEDGKGGLPTFSIKISNVTRALTGYIEQTNGLENSTITIKVVHSDHLDLTTPELEEIVDVLNVNLDLQWVTLQLGSESPIRMRSPRNRYLKDVCRYGSSFDSDHVKQPGFKGPLCGYIGEATSCNRSFARCKELGNGSRFGGFPSVSGGMYVYGESNISPYFNLNYIYYGTSTKASGYTSSDVVGLSGYSRSNDNTRVFSVTPGTTEYIVFASPVRLGLVLFVINGFVGGFNSHETVSVTNSMGFTESYYVWVSVYTNLGPTTVTTKKA